MHSADKEMTHLQIRAETEEEKFFYRF